MKEKEFNKKFPEQEIKIPIFWTLDEKNNVLIDFDSMNEEWEKQIRKLEKI